MARNVTLRELVTLTKVEIGHSIKSSVGIDFTESLKVAIRTTQQWLYDNNDWPFLNARRDKTLQAGQRYYDFPDDLPYENITKVSVLDNGIWIPVPQGITAEEFNIHDSDNDERADPVLRWDVIDAGSGEQIEVWPLPASNGAFLRLEGKKGLAPLVADDDRAALDDRLISLHAALDFITDQGKLQFKTSKAQTLLSSLRGRASKNRRFTMGGGEESPRRPRGEIHVTSRG